jgi:hypothetical protein
MTEGGDKSYLFVGLLISLLLFVFSYKAWLARKTGLYAIVNPKGSPFVPFLFTAKKISDSEGAVYIWPILIKAFALFTFICGCLLTIGVVRSLVSN